MTQETTGAESVRWDLEKIFGYSGVDDPHIERDAKHAADEARAFGEKFKGRLSSELGAAVERKDRVETLANKPLGYLQMLTAVDTGNTAAKSKLQHVLLMINKALAQHITFFKHEVAQLDQGVLEHLTAADERVAKFRPLLDRIRFFQPHMLCMEVEKALDIRSQFGPASWSNFFDEVEADLRFVYKGEELTLQATIHALTASKDADERITLMKILNDGLGGYFAKFSAETLNNVIGAKKIEDEERGFTHPMEKRNKASLIPSDVVEALHAAMPEKGRQYAKEFYTLKAQLLGLPLPMSWCHRNAPMPFKSDAIIPWNEAREIVTGAFDSFSPTLAKDVRSFFESGWIDAPPTNGKTGSAFNYSLIMPDGSLRTLTLMNYFGRPLDVATLAHELGHAVQGARSAQVNGEQLLIPPMPYAETASVFAELITFEHLKQRLLARGDEKGKLELLALIMGKVDDILNTVVRQISFSNFERLAHAHDPRTMTRGDTRRLSVKELNANWIRVCQDAYGDVFTLENAEHLWTYVGHFHSPFYVYAYAFGELLTHSLYAKRHIIGDLFEERYIRMLSDASRTDVVGLLKPFGLDARDPSFWSDGLDASLGSFLAQARKLVDELALAG